MMFATVVLPLAAYHSVMTTRIPLVDVPGLRGSSGALLGGDLVARIVADEEAAECDSAASE